MQEHRYCKRLIEVDLPIKRISKNAREEKEQRRSHVPLLYIWPATRPPSACRAIICATVWPDPNDKLCPSNFLKTAKKEMHEWANNCLGFLSEESYRDFIRYQKNHKLLDSFEELQKALLHFIADFSDSSNANREEYIRTSQILTSVAHEDLHANNLHPLVIDPFAGGGAIPLEALRVGMDVFSSDLNSVAVFYNKMILELIPRYKEKLIEELSKWSIWIKNQLHKELAEFYPNSTREEVPIAYLWARQIKCEGPGCGCEIPLIRTLRLIRDKKQPIGLKITALNKEKQIKFEIVTKEENISSGTIKRGAAICPCCGYTTPVKSVRKQLMNRVGGTDDARMFCVVTIKKGSKGRSYRVPIEEDLKAFHKAQAKLREMIRTNKDIVPNESLPVPLPGKSGTMGIGLQGYGIQAWGNVFNSRQALAHVIFIELSKKYFKSFSSGDDNFKRAFEATICLVLNRLVDLNSSLCGWQLNTPNTAHTFVRWALNIMMDYGEINPLAGAGGSLDSVMRRILSGLSNLKIPLHERVNIQQGSATNVALPDDAADYFITDPPYYDAVPYADLSDFFYVWMKRLIGTQFGELFQKQHTNKDEECIVNTDQYKDSNYFEKQMEKALAEGRRVVKPDGLGVVIFAHKSTSGWESLLQAILNAGWFISASWPIDTEMQSRLRAQNSATLSSSVHIVCRPRENIDGSLIRDRIGDWRDVLGELPIRIHDWMPRLALEGVVGADAIFACLGPALEIFSKYSQVEKANGEKVELREYLEQVWGAVAKEALNMIFQGVRTEDFEEDARLTAMWLWTLSTGKNGNNKEETDGDTSEEDSDSEKAKIKTSGFALEYDAARKIAQGLGAHLENLSSLVEIDGNRALLLSVADRVKFLFGKDSTTSTVYQKKKKEKQMTMFEQLGEIEEKGWSIGDGKSSVGKTVLDRLHQTMILFGAGRSEALRRFLVEEGIGKDERFWRLAQALSALYPTHTDEKRWVDGVLAKKKSFGF